MIDVAKPLKAKIYDFDSLWDMPDGSDVRGEYIVRQVEIIILPHLPYAKLPEISYQGGGRSVYFTLLPQEDL